jgi:hypothetical protein
MYAADAFRFCAGIAIRRGRVRAEKNAPPRTPIVAWRGLPEAPQAVLRRVAVRVLDDSSLHVLPERWP